MRDGRTRAVRVLAAGTAGALVAGLLAATGAATAQAMELEGSTGGDPRPTVVTSQNGHYNSAVVNRDIGLCQLESGTRAGLFTAGAYQGATNAITDSYAGDNALMEQSYVDRGLDPTTSSKWIGYGSSFTRSWDTRGLTARCVGDTDGDGIDSIVTLDLEYQRAALRQGSGTVNARGVAGMKPSTIRYQWAPQVVFDRETPANGVGDLDGDGRNEFMIAESAYSTAEDRDEGRIWVLRGENIDDLTPNTYTRDLTGSLPGTAVWATIVGPTGAKLDVTRPVADVNGDGRSDLLVGSSSSPSVWVVYGKTAGEHAHEIDLADLDAADGVEIARSTDGSPLGSAIVATKDLTGDGTPDLVLGTAPGVDGRGGVAVVNGPIARERVDIDPVAGQVGAGGARGLWISPEQADDGLGYSVDVLRNFGGEGEHALILGAPGYDVGGGDGLVNGGAAYVLHGLAASGRVFLSELTEQQGYRIDGEPRDADYWGPTFDLSDTPVRLGVAVAEVGDVDGNGAIDFAVNAKGRYHEGNYPYFPPGQIHVALRGEIGTRAEISAARVSGVDAVNLSGRQNVVDATTETLRLRGNLRARTLDGISRPIRFTVDDAVLETCGTPTTQAQRALTIAGYGYCSGASVVEYGRHQLRTDFAGSPGTFGPSVSAPLEIFVTDDTVTRVTVDDAQVDRATTAVAAVAPVSSASVVDDGVVDFFTIEGAETVRIAECQNVPVSGGSASCELVPAEAGELTIRASYAGLDLPRAEDRDDTVRVLRPSVSADAPLTVSETGAIDIAVAKTQAPYGERVRVNIASHRLPTGTVDVRVDGRTAATAELRAGRATVLLPVLDVGAHAVTALLPGADGVATAVSGEERLEVRKARVDIAAPKAAASSQPFGTARPVTVRATVTGLASGRVDLYAGAQKVGSAAIVRGQVTWRLPSKLRLGGHALAARFAGSGTHEAARSSKTGFTVRKDAPGIRITTSRFDRGAKPRVSVSVSRLASGARPTGRVTVTAGSVSRTVKLRAAHRGSVTVTLPARKTSVTVRAVFTPTSTATVARTTATKKITAK